MTEMQKLADFIEAAKPGWLPISGHVVNITFSLHEREVLLAALRAPEAADHIADAGKMVPEAADAEAVAPVGYVSPRTLQALNSDANGAGPIVGCAGFDTTIPVYASPTAAGIAAGPDGVRATSLASFIEDKIEVDFVLGDDKPIFINSLALAEAIIARGYVPPAASADAVRELFRGYIEIAHGANKHVLQALERDIAALSAPVAGADAGMRYRHIKRGSTYTVMGEARIQSDEPLFDMSDVVIYRCDEDGGLWARPPAEFNDGRFEALPASGEVDLLCGNCKETATRS